MTSSPVGWSKRLTHLDSRAVLVCSRCRTPKPPWSTGRHKVSYETKAIPRDSSFGGPRQKKSLMLRSKRLRTPTSILKMDIKCIGMAARTALRSTRRPPRESKRAREPARRDSTFSITDCQSCVRSRRSTNGRPKYRIGRVPIGVANNREHPVSSSGDSPKPMKDDFSRLSLRPEKSEKMSIIVDKVWAAAHDP